jgi:hypothetical protein
MQTPAATCCFSAILAVLATVGPGASLSVGADKDDKPKQLPAEAVRAWAGAGANVGWMIDLPPKPTGGYQYWEPYRENAEAGALPAFRFHVKEGDLAKLPDPGVPFGIDLHCWSGTDADLKTLARFKCLHSLNVGGALLLTDAGLRELTALKNLRGLYLFYAPITDAGLKHIAALSDLQALDLSNSQVTGPGLKELAGLKKLQGLNLGDTHVTDAGSKELAALKSLQRLNLRRTKVTPAGIAALEKQLPKCKILSGDDAD